MMLERLRALPLVALAVGGPGLIWAAVIAFLLAAGAAGVQPHVAPPLTLPEAAGLASEADIVRLLRSGAAIDAPADVRRRILGSRGYRVTPLEAAVGSKRDRVMELLLDAGATLDRTNFPVLYCLSRVKNAPEISEVLERRFRPGAPVDCAAVQLPW